MNSVDWLAIETLAQQLEKSYIDDADKKISDWGKVIFDRNQTKEILRFGALFFFLTDGRAEQWGLADIIYPLIVHIAELAFTQGIYDIAGGYWHQQGQYLHRLGQTEQAIQAFENSTHAHKSADNEFEGAKSYYMTALCYRVLGDYSKTQSIIHEVLELTQDNLWRANPLIVQAWIERDSGNLEKAVSLMIEALDLLQTNEKEDQPLLIAQTWADLADVQTLLNHFIEAQQNFEMALQVLKDANFIDYRQEARIFLKKAKLFRRQKQWKEQEDLLYKAHLRLIKMGNQELLAQLAFERGYTALSRFRLLLALNQFLLCYEYLQALGFSLRAVTQRFRKRFLRS